VTSITGFPNYPQGKIYPGYHQRPWQKESIDGVSIVRLPLYPDHSRSSLCRTLNYASFAASASILGPILCDSADVMWVYHPPLTVGLPAWWIGLTRSVPFVYEIQDIWPETLAATGMVSSDWILRWLGTVAQFVYRRAAAITVISPGFKENLRGKGVPAEKIHVIPNWAHEEIYRPVPYDHSLAELYGMRGRFNIVYGGNLGAAQAMHSVLAAARQLSDIPDIQFVLIGDGVDENALKRQVAEQGIENVRFVSRQPAERMPHFYALADVLLVHLKRDPLFEITIPGKTTAYLACGRPVLCAVAGEAANVVREAGAGLVCPPEEPKALAQVVREFYEMPVEQREAMGHSGRQAFLSHYSQDKLVDRYEELLTEVAFQRKVSAD
jgi:glycosyltransferase involved in cell wall biosynthesis